MDGRGGESTATNPSRCGERGGVGVWWWQPELHGRRRGEERPPPLRKGGEAV